MTTYELLSNLIPFYLAKTTLIVFAALVGLLLSQWKWVLVAAVGVALAENVVLNVFVYMFFGPSRSGATLFRNTGVYLADLGSSLAAYLFWATVFFFMKQFVLAVLSRLRGR
jgi:hypothetical protein